MGTKLFIPKAWLVFQTGCIECGEDSSIVGVYSTKADAIAASKVADAHHAANWHGQRYTEVYDLENYATHESQDDSVIDGSVVEPGRELMG